jgi:NTP pyrophosphatase (non-canonical NTP hydrolase)
LRWKKGWASFEQLDVDKWRLVLNRGLGETVVEQRIDTKMRDELYSVLHQSKEGREAKLLQEIVEILNKYLNDEIKTTEEAESEIWSAVFACYKERIDGFFAEKKKARTKSNGE